MSAKVGKGEPLVFISYSWEDGEHNLWVESFAAALRGHGVNSTIDKWEVGPGSPLPVFMERSVRDSSHILMVCTPRYKKKYDARKGGAGFEAELMAGDRLAGAVADKFIPVLRKGTMSNAVPTLHAGKLAIDLTKDHDFTGEQYRSLLYHVRGIKLTPAPPIVGFELPPVRVLPMLSGVLSERVDEAVAHDRQTFERSDQLFDEEQLSGLFDWVSDHGWIWNKQRVKLQEYHRALRLTKNSYVNKVVESARVDFQQALDGLVGFMALHFFHRMDAPAASAQCAYLYPDLNFDFNPAVSLAKSLYFQEMYKELCERCDAAKMRYGAFRATVKQILLV